MTKLGIFNVCLAASLSLAATSAAHADALDLMRQFNVITFGDFQTSSDVEGRAMVGGNLDGLSTMANNSSRPPYGSSTYGELTVYGNNNSGNSTSIDLAGGVTILGNNNGSFTAKSGNISVGGSNSGKLTTSSGSVTVLGSNSNTLSSTNDTVFVGNGNSGEIDTNGTNGNIAIVGNNSATLKPANGGSVQIQGNNYGSVNMNGGSLAVSGSSNRPNGSYSSFTTGATVSLTAPSVSLPNFATTFKTPLTQLSSQLAGLASTGSFSTASGKTTLSATAGASGVAVLNLTSALFAQNTNIYVDVPDGTSLVINITIPGCILGSGCSLDINSSVHIYDTNSATASNIASYLLWNFEDATSLTIGTAWEGSILAPYATVTDQNQAIDGTVVANSYSGNGELHSYAFTGSLTPSGGNTPVPEPSSIAVLLSGLAAVGWLRRRKRA